MHVAIALSSVAFTTYLLFRPTLRNVRTNYVLIGATLVSGTILVIASRANLLHACITGLAYVSIMTAGTALARRKIQA